MRASWIGLLLLCGCMGRGDHANPDAVISMQIMDRNGFSETISGKERLSQHIKTDFLTAQPYKKVLRVFGRTPEGKSHSKITTYHPNGHPWQYLEITDGRAHGVYQEWYPNGQKKLATYVIEGTPDVSEVAQMTWLFEGKSQVWNEEGVLVADLSYEKGLLEGPSLYYHPNGQLAKEIPYTQDAIHGMIVHYNPNGMIVEKLAYHKGLKEGESAGYWDDGKASYLESWKAGLLLNGLYYDSEQNLLSEVKEGIGKQALFKEGKLFSLVEYQNNVAEGSVQIFNEEGGLSSIFHVKDGKKHGEEVEYYPTKDGSLKPKISIQWEEDSIQGVVKTWYQNGTVESQREMNGNKKHGLAFAWFKTGGLMLMEEYEEDTLVKGSYYKKGDRKAVSKIENGKGLATLYDSEGRFLRKVSYEKGIPLTD